MSNDTAFLPRINALDSIRGGCALAVVLCHIQLPVKYSSTVISILFNTIANGPAAVVIFFLISGFCIHYPFSQGAKVPVINFLIRRSFRIGVPLAIATFLAFGTNSESGLYMVSWSLFAELIYYFLYPFLNYFGAKYGWKPIVLIGFISSFLVMYCHSGLVDFPSFGILYTWIVGFPIWLLGCNLAESCKGSVVKFSSLFALRIVVVISSLITIFLGKGYFFVFVNFPLLLVLFGCVAYFWLKAEILWYSQAIHSVLFSRFGQLSFSLYLTHIIVIHLGWEIQMSFQLPQLLFRGLQLFVSILFAMCFYIAVERPVHKIARTFHIVN